jgi:hypothetical protein
VPPILEALGIAEARHIGAGRERTNAADASQSTTVVVLPMPEHDLTLECGELLLEFRKLRLQPAAAIRAAW